MLRRNPWVYALDFPTGNPLQVSSLLGLDLEYLNTLSDDTSNADREILYKSMMRGIPSLLPFGPVVAPLLPPWKSSAYDATANGDASLAVVTLLIDFEVIESDVNGKAEIL